ncbi:hypothetical protein [Nonomuraea phyllanthi]|uniref:hypothetical protein n=1 Tax=Nonomuraea phyllanthi TaxID=2219224 RepID=UPI00186B3FEF|nr:hypothetical protein [Nonomuraea phyllanthi]
MQEELRSLPGDLADLVGRHLVAAEQALEEDDPDRAHEHTKVARRFAARIGVVREAAGIVAYRAGHFSEALSDLRAARRMTGSDAYLPVMADCERGLGRPERAIDLVRSREAERLDRAGRIELTIVESGARRDLGQHDAAVITLQRLPELRDPQPRPWSARLAFAYADALADAGQQDAATEWFGRAMAFDEDGETDAAERYAELTGAVIEDVEEDFDDEDAAEALEGATGTEAGDLLDDADAPESGADAQDGAPRSEGHSGGSERTAERPGTSGESEENAEQVGRSSDTAGRTAEQAGASDASARTAEQAETSGAPDGTAAQTVPSDEPAQDAEETAPFRGPGPDAEETAPADGPGQDTAEPSDGPEQDIEQAAPSDAPGPAGSSSDDLGDAAGQVGQAGREKGAAPAVPDAEPQATPGAHAEAPGITPAFIEPDFGDVLSERDERASDGEPKTDD